MFKSRLSKTQVRIGLSRTDKPRGKSPIKITPAPGVKPRTLGLSRSYKAPKNIDNLVESKILTYPIKDSIRMEESNKPNDTEIISISNISSVSEQELLQSDGTLINNNTNFHKAPNGITIPDVETIDCSSTQGSSNNKRLHSQSKQIKESVAVPIKNRDTPKTPDKLLENDDISISYSPLDSTPNAENLKYKKVLKAKRLINGKSPRNILDSCLKGFDKKLSATSSTCQSSSMKTKKNSRLSLKKSRTVELTDDENEEEMKPNKKIAKMKSFDSHFNDCSVLLNHLANDIVKANNETHHKEQITISDEEKNIEFVDLSQNSREIYKKKLIENIISFNQLFKSQNVQLHALKQSVIYKKKHNIQDLTALAEIWKTGCKSAVADLLINLREVVQSNMTMDELLKQLNIPGHIFKYDIEAEELI